MGLVVGRFVAYSLPVRRSLAPAGTPSPRRVEDSDLPPLVDANPRWSACALRQRLDEGQVGFLWEEGGRLVHCRWVSSGECRLPYLGRRFRPGPGRVVAVEAFTVRGARRAGHYRRSLDHFLDWAAQAGAAEALFFAAWWHRPTRSALESVPGAQRIGALTRVLWSRWPSGRIVPVEAGVLGVDGPER